MTLVTPPITVIDSIPTLITFEEGYKLTPYPGSRNGNWNVGVGHNMTANGLPLPICYDLLKRIPTSSVSAISFFKDELASYGDENSPFSVAYPFPGCLHLIQKTQDKALTPDEVEELFTYDVSVVTGFLPTLVPNYATINPIRQAALIDMGFNLGQYDFSLFDTFLFYVKERNWQSAVEDLSHTKVYGELTERYERITFMLTYAEWPQI